MKVLKEIASIVKEVIEGWTNSGGSLLAASLAYYTIFSLAPLLVIAIWLAGIFFSEDAATGALLDQFGMIASAEVSQSLRATLEHTRQAPSRGLTTVASLALTLIGASIVFVQLKRAINLLWGLMPQPGQGLFIIMRTHLFSFTLVLLIASLLLISMFISGVFTYLQEHIYFLPFGVIATSTLANMLCLFLVFALLFAIILKPLPDAFISWKDVWLGAGVTSFLFILGEYLIGIYLSKVKLGGFYGAANSLIAILVWVYYSMHIVLIGAKFTQVYADRFGDKVNPSSKAELIIRKRMTTDEKLK